MENFQDMGCFITPAASQKLLINATFSVRLERHTFCATTTDVNRPDDTRLYSVARCVPGIPIQQKVGALCNKSVPFYMLAATERSLGLATGCRLALGNPIYGNIEKVPAIQERHRSRPLSRRVHLPCRHRVLGHQISILDD